MLSSPNVKDVHDVGIWRRLVHAVSSVLTFPLFPLSYWDFSHEVAYEWRVES